MNRAGTKDTVATRIAETLHGYGVRFAFGIPGNDVLELIRACEAQGITFVLAKSEPSAGFMADAVAQVTGAPTVCIFALGPGVANGVTGVAGALMERTPVIILGGEMASDRRGLYTHQVFDHVALMTPVTKWAADLNPARAAQQTAKALDIALTEPRGPVYLNCAADATRTDAVDVVSAPSAKHFGVADDEVLGEARRALEAARQPLALIGLGALRPGVAGPLADFLESRGIPFLTTFKAKGAVSERHDLALGALGLSPIVDAPTQELVGEADHLTLIGFDPIELRDAWLNAWSTDKACLTVDWSAQTNRVFPQGPQLLGDVSATLSALARDAVPNAAWPGERLADYKAAVRKIVAPRSPETGVSPGHLFSVIDAGIDESMHLSVDVGAHRILACHALHCVTPGQLLQSNGLCSMGYAISAAIGATLAGAGERAVAMLGDGCALMSLGDLAVIAERELPVTVIVLNDDSLALIELKQSKMQLETGAVRFRSPDFAAIARGFGIAALRATTNAEFTDAYEKARQANGPILIDAVCDASEYWEQM